MKARSVPTDVREFLAVLGVGAVGLTMAAAVALTPWYAPGRDDDRVVDMRAPAAPAAQGQDR